MTLSLECMPEVKARHLTDQLRQSLTISWELLTEAYTGRVWLSLGYESWNDYTTAELGEVRLRLPRDERQQVVASLTEAGMSTRAIGAALGVHHDTVSDDRRRVGNPTPADEPIDAEVVEDPRPVLGTDGKTYTVTARPKPNNLAIPQPPRYGPRRKHRQVLEAVAAGLSGTAMALDDITELDTTVTKGEAAQLVRDLSQQIRSIERIRALLMARVPDDSPRPGHRRALPLVARDVAYELRKAVEKAERLLDNDRYSANAEMVTALLHHDLEYAAKTCTELTGRLHKT